MSYIYCEPCIMILLILWQNFYQDKKGETKEKTKYYLMEGPIATAIKFANASPYFSAVTLALFTESRGHFPQQ